jgi:hypothetical protein
VEQAVPSERALYGWIAPGEDDPAFAAMNVAMEILSAPKLARLDRVLVEPGYAARVRAVLDIGSLASTAAIEIIPAARTVRPTARVCAPCSTPRPRSDSPQPSPR